MLGLMVVYSASAAKYWAWLLRQATSFAVGFTLMIFCAQVPPKVYQAISPYFYHLRHSDVDASGW